MATQFIIRKNDYLSQDTVGYHSCFYYRFGEPGNPNYINTLKNTFNNKSIDELIKARDTVTDILIEEIPQIMYLQNMWDCVLVAVPRAKKFDSYTPQQLMLIDAISNAAKQLPDVEDGTKAIQRHTSTRTTHLNTTVERVTSSGQREANDGKEPFPGITEETCSIYRQFFYGKNVILIDDIYTKNVDIDEDCIQAVLNHGAKKVVFYSIAYTKSKFER